MLCTNVNVNVREKAIRSSDTKRACVCVCALSVENSVRYNSGDNANNAKLESDTTTNSGQRERHAMTPPLLHCIAFYYSMTYPKSARNNKPGLQSCTSLA